jgi:hypothetical protein
MSNPISGKMAQHLVLYPMSSEKLPIRKFFFFIAYLFPGMPSPNPPEWFGTSSPEGTVRCT